MVFGLSKTAGGERSKHASSLLTRDPPAVFEHAQKLSTGANRLAFSHQSLDWWKVFDIFKRKDPVCGMKEEKGKGIEKHEKWFCSGSCVKEYEKAIKESRKMSGSGGCCH